MAPERDAGLVPEESAQDAPAPGHAEVGGTDVGSAAGQLTISPKHRWDVFVGGEIVPWLRSQNVPQNVAEAVHRIKFFPQEDGRFRVVLQHSYLSTAPNESVACAPWMRRRGSSSRTIITGRTTFVTDQWPDCVPRP